MCLCFNTLVYNPRQQQSRRHQQTNLLSHNTESTLTVGDDKKGRQKASDSIPWNSILFLLLHLIVNFSCLPLANNVYTDIIPTFLGRFSPLLVCNMAG